MISKFKDYRFTIWVIIVVVLLILVILGLKTPAKYGDGGLLSDKPCSAPCFLGITPGKTDKDQAINIIKDQGFVEYSEGYSGTQDHVLSFSGVIYLGYNQDQPVSLIEFEPTVKVRVRDVIDKYGEPSRISVAYDLLSTPEDNYFDMHLYYDQIHAYLVLPHQKNWPAYEISGKTLVERVIYFDEAAYRDAIHMDRHLTDWKGFGSYQDPAP